MKNVSPPAWMQLALRLLLSTRDQDTVSGDLHEEFCERKLPEFGPFRAHLWYMRQVFSFVPRRLASAFVQPEVLLGLCVFTFMAGTWLGGMDLYLRRPGYADREYMAAIITGQALVTLIALRFHSSVLLKRLAMAGCFPILWLAVSAALAATRGSHPEGYVLLIALALLLQAVLTFCSLPAVRSGGGLKA
jgi:hypothetical protein